MRSQALIFVFFISLFVISTRSEQLPNPSGYFYGVYLPDWLKWNSGNCGLDLATVDPTRWTHIIVAFANFDSNFKVAAWQNDDDYQFGTPSTTLYQKVEALKTKNPKLKTMISLGGEGTSSPFPQMVSSQSNINTLCTSLIKFLRDNKFDGVDIDWETSTEAQAPGVTNFFKTLRARIDAEVVPNGKSRLAFTTAVGPWPDCVKNFPPAAIAYGTWNDPAITRSATPLTSASDFDYGVKQSAEMWVNAGIPKSKVVPGFSNYFTSYKLQTATDKVMYTSFTGGGPAGDCGVGDYYDLESVRKKGKNVYHGWDSQTQTPFMNVDGNMLCHEDQRSIDAKVKFIKDNGYGGGFAWALTYNSTITDYIGTTLLSADGGAPVGSSGVTTAGSGVTVGSSVDPADTEDPVDPTSTSTSTPVDPSVPKNGTGNNLRPVSMNSSSKIAVISSFLAFLAALLL